MDSQLYKNIADSNAHRKSREDNAAFVLSNHLADDLITLALDTANKEHFKACWTLELVLEEDLGYIKDRKHEFFNALPDFTNDSALRSVSKICMLCAQRLKKDPDFLTSEQIDQITEACFKWVVSEEKVATKAYAIRALFETGKRLDWVYKELIPVLQHGYPEHSAAYRAVAKEILPKINR